jgi:superfamily II DNA/RNA helicase
MIFCAWDSRVRLLRLTPSFFLLSQHSPQKKYICLFMSCVWLVHILVGTPGRVLDLGGKGIADLSFCKMFVMDEADKLLSPEFQPVNTKIFFLL